MTLALLIIAIGVTASGATVVMRGGVVVEGGVVVMGGEAAGVTGL
jgi:hypothetical protein